MRSIFFAHSSYSPRAVDSKRDYFLGKIATEHSYRALGNDYSVDIAVKPVLNARLVLFNKDLAKELNLALPDTDTEIEAEIVKNFAWFKADEQQSYLNHADESKFFFATRYQDADDKAEGSALGDGRALWLGEIITEFENGCFQYADVVLKGTGVTPLAWFNHPRTTHKDGMVSMSEAVYEYIYSQAAKACGINVVGVLAVIELPFMREASGEKAAIVVRVGNHLRFAHYRYFSDTPKLLEKIFEYGLKRDLEVSLNHFVDSNDVLRYLNLVVNNVAEDAAVYFDVHAVHGSPTFGNRTSCGGTIDLSTFVFPDAHHSDYSYMDGGVNSLGGDWGQTEQFFNLFSKLQESLKSSGFKYAAEILPTEYFFRQFKIRFEDVLTYRWLTRLGLSDKEINLLSTDTKENFYSIVKSIYEAKGSKKILFNEGKILTAAFEPRKILSGTAECLENMDDAALLWTKLFKVQRNWSTYKFADAKPYIKAYQKSILRIVNELQAATESVTAWKKNSQKIRLAERNEPGEDFFYGSERFFVMAEILPHISSGDVSWSSLSEAAKDSISKLADYGFVSI
jgi:hypothetical protein